MQFFKQLFCKHYYVEIKRETDRSVVSQLNYYGYHAAKSKCRLCGKQIDHD